MKTESLVRLLAGTVTLTGVALAYYRGPIWLLVPAFAGLNLIQSVFTGICPPSWLLTRLGWLGADGIIRIGGAKGGRP